MPDCAEVAKSQRVRLLDVFVLGPFMLWYAFHTSRRLPVASFVLVLIALGTILYNLKNYSETEQANNARA